MTGPGLLKWVEIDRSAIAANFRWIRERLANGTELMAVLKADGYGHGAEQIARIAAKSGASTLGVLDLEEAKLLRRAGIRRRIVLLCPPLPYEARDVVQNRVEPTVDSIELARALNKAAGKKAVRIHVDVDFGLGRWGMPVKEVDPFFTRLSRLKHLIPTGLSAHLDYIPGKNAVEAEEQLGRFRRLAAKLKKRHPKLVRHCANSSIFLDFPHWQLDMVRIGNLIYGINPTGKEAALKQAWHLKARIVSLKEVGKGRSIGYASEYLAPRRMKVAALPVGYADGLTMEPAERFIGLGRGFRYWGWLRGHKVPFVGRSGISHILIDVSGVPAVGVGDIVTLPVRRTAASLRLPKIYLD